MAKNKKENKSKLIKSIVIAVVVTIVILIIGILLCQNNVKWPFNQNLKQINNTIKDNTTIEKESLVLKSKSAYNKIIEYKFENDILKSVTIYEQFEEKEQFEAEKKNYEIQDDIIVKNINEQELSIEIEKKDFGTDTGLSYDEIYDKYLVQIIGAYEKI